MTWKLSRNAGSLIPRTTDLMNQNIYFGLAPGRVVCTLNLRNTTQSRLTEGKRRPEPPAGRHPGCQPGEGADSRGCQAVSNLILELWLLCVRAWTDGQAARHQRNWSRLWLGRGVRQSPAQRAEAEPRSLGMGSQAVSGGHGGKKSSAGDSVREKLKQVMLVWKASVQRTRSWEKQRSR